MNQKTIEEAVAKLLEALDIDISDPNFTATPKRIAKMYIEELKLPEPKLAIFPSDYEQMIVLKGHTTYTRCPHHLERVKLVVDIGYLPNECVIGLSKLARSVDYICAGFYLQEDITDRIVNFLQARLDPRGCGVVVTGQHLCMQARGVRTDAVVTTSALRKYFQNVPSVKEEFFHRIGG